MSPRTIPTCSHCRWRLASAMGPNDSIRYFCVNPRCEANAGSTGLANYDFRPCTHCKGTGIEPQETDP
jgi:hypothetical protein